VSVNELVLLRGAHETRSTLARWNRDPWPVLGAWTAGSLAVAGGLLIAVLAVASNSPVDLSPMYVPGLDNEAALSDVTAILARNSLVLALHAIACVAGFIACSSLALSAAHRTGVSRWIHERARPVALAWVILVTCFSLVTQAYALGLTGAQLANQLELSPAVLIVTVIPHAVPELVAVFLPLAAWTIASRRDEWNELLAATLATVVVAIPILIAAATWEAYVWPRILAAASPGL
jgi:Stage II sporulation protein M